MVGAGLARAREDDLAAIAQSHPGAVRRVTRDGVNGVETGWRAHRRRCGPRSSSESTHCSRFHWNETGELARRGEDGAVQGVGGGADAGSGKELDGDDLPLDQVYLTAGFIPHPQPVGQIVGRVAIEEVLGAVLQDHADLGAARLDQLHVAEAGPETGGCRRPGRSRPASSIPKRSMEERSGGA